MFDVRLLHENVSKVTNPKLMKDWMNKNRYRESRINKNEIPNFFEKLDESEFSTNDKSVQMCYLFQAHCDIPNLVSEIKFVEKKFSNIKGLNLVEEFKFVCNFYSQKLSKKFKKVSSAERRRNCEIVNLEQQYYLSKKLNQKINLSKPERNLVLYFRDNSGIVGKSFVDSMEFSMICFILDKFIYGGYSKLFTNVIITSRDDGIYPQILTEIFPNIKYEYKKNCDGDFNYIENEFSNLCGVCANTIHFTNGKFYEIETGSIPILTIGTIYDETKMGMFAEKTAKIGLCEDVDYVKLNLNYEKYNDFHKYSKMNLKFFHLMKVFNKSGRFSTVMEEIIRSVSKLEDVVIEQARQKLVSENINNN